MKQKISKELKDELLFMADHMAASATIFSSHGYDSFITARDTFIRTLYDLDLARKTVPECATEDFYQHSRR